MMGFTNIWLNVLVTSVNFHCVYLGVNEDDGFEQLAALVGMVCEVLSVPVDYCGYHDTVLLCALHQQRQRDREN